MKPQYYPNCSELIADFILHDPVVMLNILHQLIEFHGWSYQPKPTLDLLKTMIDNHNIEITVLNRKGLSTTLRYGSNGYEELGFRLDSSGSDYDSTQYSFFKDVQNDFNAEVKAYDGGSTKEFEKWCNKH